LKRNHPYRRLKKAFNDCQEDRTAPPPLTGEEEIQPSVPRGGDFWKNPHE